MEVNIRVLGQDAGGGGGGRGRGCAVGGTGAWLLLGLGLGLATGVMFGIALGRDATAMGMCVEDETASLSPRSSGRMAATMGFSMPGAFTPLTNLTRRVADTSFGSCLGTNGNGRGNGTLSKQTVSWSMYHCKFDSNVTMSRASSATVPPKIRFLQRWLSSRLRGCTVPIGSWGHILGEVSHSPIRTALASAMASSDRSTGGGPWDGGRKILGAWNRGTATSVVMMIS
jgi:hypothetical protein